MSQYNYLVCSLPCQGFKDETKYGNRFVSEKKGKKRDSFYRDIYGRMFFIQGISHCPYCGSKLVLGKEINLYEQGDLLLP